MGPPPGGPTMRADSVADWIAGHYWTVGVAFVVALMAAYWFTLTSFLDNLRLDTPLAYLPMLPLFAMGTAWLTARRAASRSEPDSGRELDPWLAAPLLLVALLLITVVPLFWSTLYWIDRLDVLSLAMFVTGGVTLLYGVGWTWRLRAPLLLLFLMWPALYVHALPQVLEAASETTNTALGWLVANLPLGVRRGSDPSLLLINTGGPAPLLVSVGSACSGANSVLGFALVGGVTSTMLVGSLVRKLAWLMVGLALAFVANVIRLVSILLLSSAGQPTLALGAYHEVIGLVLFVAVIAVGLALLPLFHLRTGVERDPPSANPPTPRPELPSGRRLLTKAPTIFVLAVMLTVTAAADRSLAAYASWMSTDGIASAQPFGADTLPRGWELHHVANYPWGVQYFGAGSSFNRFVLVADEQTVVADVVSTTDAARLSAYNLQSCFLFHNDQVRTLVRVDLGHGVTGQLIDYYDRASGKQWASVSWIWPVRYRGGTSYERVALSSDLVRGSAAAPRLDFSSSGLAAWLLTYSQQLVGAPTANDRTFDAVNARMKGVAAALIAATNPSLSRRM